MTDDLAASPKCSECWSAGESEPAAYEMHVNNKALDPIYACPAHVGYLVRLHLNLIKETIRVWLIAEDTQASFDSMGVFHAR